MHGSGGQTQEYLSFFFNQTLRFNKPEPEDLLKVPFEKALQVFFAPDGFFFYLCKRIFVFCVEVHRYNTMKKIRKKQMLKTLTTKNTKKSSKN